MRKRFLWGGAAMVLVGGGFFLLAAGVVPGLPPGAVALGAAASFSLLTGILLLLLRNHLASLEEALRAVSDAVREPGDDSPVPSPPRALAEAVRRRLDRRRWETDLAVDGARRDLERRILEFGATHNDLIVHHRVTKMMLRSGTAKEVLEHLFAGIREGLGFPGAVIGVLDGNGTIVFDRGRGEEGRGGPGIPCWEQESLFGRTLWNGKPLLLSTPEGQRVLREERAILGEGTSFLVPVLRKPGTRCTDVHSCGDTACPAHDGTGVRCWLEGFSTCRPRDPASEKENRRECSRCRAFAPCAILVVGSHPLSRALNGENTERIASLAEEASIALELVELNEQTRQLAITDGLTGLVNHREFYRSLGRELERARRYGHNVSLLMADVDNFKSFNDRHGHLAGDAALKKIAGLLRGCVRANDIVARYGGEEFGIILPESTPSGALMLAERIKTEIGTENFLKSSEEIAHLTVSIGIYSADPGEDSEETMVKFADEAAYQAKRAGKNRVVVKEHA